MRGKSKDKNKDSFKELVTKLNSLALNILDDIYDARITKKKIDFEEFKVPLLAIKEIKDLVKTNDKIKNNETSDILNFDVEDLRNDKIKNNETSDSLNLDIEDLGNVITLEEELNNEEEG